jgi:hypothetical protein
MAMPGVSQIEIRETSQTLKALMREQITLEARERLHALYLLQSAQALNITHTAQHIDQEMVPAR